MDIWANLFIYNRATEQTKLFFTNIYNFAYLSKLQVTIYNILYKYIFLFI